LRTHPWWPSLNNPWVHRHQWDKLWSFSWTSEHKICTCVALPRSLFPDSRQMTRVCE
jgi:hypothetical protein